MLDGLVPAIILPPILAAAALGLGLLTGRIHGEAWERASARLVTGATASSLLAALAATFWRGQGSIPEQINFGPWLESGDYRIDISFHADGLGLGLSLLFGLFAWMVARFSVHYLHRETGFHRFFMILALFAGAMQLIVLAGNAPLAFAGWELAGVCSYLLIAYAYDRPTAVGNATRAFVTNRVGDAGFVLGIYFAYVWTGGVEWPQILAQGAALEPAKAGVLAACFLLAATAKSAQIPFAPWLARAMEGPTPSSAVFYGAVMVHAGVYLVLRLEPVFSQAPLVMALMALLGLATALYGFLCGLVQTDVKSALVFSTMGQVGLMFLECGLGLWSLAAWHLAAHAVVRGYQFLTAPALMHHIAGMPTRPPPAWMARQRWLYLAATRRFWLEEAVDIFTTRQVQGYAADLERFDGAVVDPLIGLSSPAAPSVDGGAPHLGGLPGRVLQRIAESLHWFEERLVLAGVGRDLIAQGRKLGTQLNRIEAGLLRPRYPTLLVVIVLLACL
ncbi:NADH-Ubiquinone oxidoreductase (complex I), chain 5 N-terminus [Methylomagnum ishizawai]|uniref:NADH-Ubiquinone oxidoreductase (Complex I), chain 5 N-terminus n=1 Tax=Methylomagnum ishizawai TaxID=1760988 RepID=A0A1Y6CW74_9GAMM|nr:proton-conducting transporter membrane subunit [Methylomagnum ishizawai]SMF94500.1 NADH-Ubiquinone oxidoreductase (complex I), chain 5 N-terminus [Methylomagnum ishizawai]